MTEAEKKEEKDFKCVCGFPCKTKESYERHIAHCEVYKAKQITQSNKLEKGNKLEEDNKSEETKEEKKKGPIIEDINLEALKLNNETVPSVKLFTIVPVRKPFKQEFFRVRKGEEWQLSTKVLDLQEEREMYLVHPSLWEILNIELKDMVFFTAINRDRVIFLIPITMPGEGGRKNKWSESLLRNIEIAKTKWIRSTSDQKVGAYEVIEAIHDLGEPNWPETVVTRDREAVPFSMHVLVNTAFYDKYIRDIENPIIKRLLGQTG